VVCYERMQKNKKQHRRRLMCPEPIKESSSYDGTRKARRGGAWRCGGKTVGVIGPNKQRARASEHAPSQKQTKLSRRALLDGVMSVPLHREEGRARLRQPRVQNGRPPVVTLRDGGDGTMSTRGGTIWGEEAGAVMLLPDNPECRRRCWSNSSVALRIAVHSRLDGCSCDAMRCNTVRRRY
jgi:hypothetical protein